MPERASVTQGIYLAAETTPGDGTTPNRILNSFDITPGAHFDMQRFRPTGQKLESIIVPGKEWTECGVEGMAEYTELHLLLSGIYGKNQVTQPNVVGPVATWEYILSARQPDTVQTYSFVHGDDNFAETFDYGLVTELNFDMSREGIKIDGSMIARELEGDAVIPHAPSSFGEVPILPKEVSVYLSDQYHLLGVTKLNRALSLKQSIGDRHNPVWVLDAAEPSFVAHVETAPKFEFEVTIAADDQHFDLLQNTRQGDTLYMRVNATSVQNIPGSATPYSYKMDAACKVADVDKFEDVDGVYAVKYTMAAVYDAENGLSVEAELVTDAVGF